MGSNNRIKYDKSTSIGNLTGSIFGLMKQEVHRQFENRNLYLKINHFPIINRLFIEDGVSQQTIAEWFGYDRPKTSRVLDELETKGFIERRDDPDSRRRKLICLSDFTKKNKPLIFEALEASFEIAYAGMSKGEIDSLVRALQKVKDNLEK